MSNGSALVVQQLIAAAIVVMLALVGLWDGYVRIFRAEWPTVSDVLRLWFEREPAMLFVAWLLMFHLLVFRK